MLNLVCHLSGIATTTAAWVEAVAGTRREDPRHPQDAAGAAGAAEVRGARRRWRQPPDGVGRCGVDQGQPRRGGGLGGGRAARRPRGGTRSAVRGRGRLARTARRCAGRERGTRSAGQLPDLADPDRGAAPRHARAPETKLESSGGLSLDTAAEYAGTGVDYLAVGALTHSVRVLDIGWISSPGNRRFLANFGNSCRALSHDRGAVLVIKHLAVLEKAVEYHLRNVYGKLGISSRRELRALS